jgi:cytochrome b561
MSTRQEQAYSPTARRFHWWTVVFVLIQVPVGIYMAYRGNTLGIFDGLTNFLYSSHKTLGIVIFIVVAWRLIYRLVHGAPPPEPTLAWWQRIGAELNHWGLYALLLLVPVLGYVGVSLYPALGLFDVVTLPGIVAPNQAAAGAVFFYHWLAAVVLVLLVAMHVGAALFHYLIRKDGVLARMLPSAGRRDGK